MNEDKPTRTDGFACPYCHEILVDPPVMVVAGRRFTEEEVIRALAHRPPVSLKTIWEDPEKYHKGPL